MTTVSEPSKCPPDTFSPPSYKKTDQKVCLFQSVKKVVFDRLTEVKEASKTSKPKASAYIGTVVLGFAQ